MHIKKYLATAWHTASAQELMLSLLIHWHGCSGFLVYGWAESRGLGKGGRNFLGVDAVVRRPQVQEAGCRMRWWEGEPVRRAEERERK